MKSITKIEDIKTFEDACGFLKLKADKVIPDLSMYPENHREGMLAHAKLVLITEALNTVENDGKRWLPDWEDISEYKYYPWFKMGSSSGVGFSFLGYGLWSTGSNVGSRLCFKSREAAEYAGKQFEDLYKTYFEI